MKQRKKKKIILPLSNLRCKIFYIYFRNVTCDECCLEKGEKVWKGFPRVYTRYTDLRKSEDVTLNRSVCGLSFKADLLFYNVCIRTKCPLLDIVSPIEGLNRGRKWEGMGRGGKEKKWRYIILKYWRVERESIVQVEREGGGGIFASILTGCLVALFLPSTSLLKTRDAWWTVKYR